jgi:hypothetical protein
MGDTSHRSFVGTYNYNTGPAAILELFVNNAEKLAGGRGFFPGADAFPGEWMGNRKM